MTDDLDDLKRMMDAATPAPDPARRSENLALAQKNFEALQGSATQPRPTSGNLISGVKTMLQTFTSKGGLTATTALIAVGFMFTPAGQSLLQSTPDLTGATSEIGKTTAVNDTVANRPITTPSVAPADADLEAIVPEAPVVMLEVPASNDAVAGRTAPIQQEAEPALTRQRNQEVSSLAANESFASDDRVAPAPADPIVLPEESTESFPEAADNPLKITAEAPVSTFSIDVDTASYSIVRNSLSYGQMPPKDAVRVEELINYFPYDYPAPEAGEGPFRPTVSTMQTPWNSDTQLVHIALQGQMPAVESRPPLNLVFLIDTSGSMNDPAKLPLLRQSFIMMLDELRPEDEVSIVTYAGSAGEILPPTPASEKGMITMALMRLAAGGSTNGQGGLEQAYATAEAMTAEGEVSRVILATDGDFNVGVSDPEGLTSYIEKKRESGTYLSVLGFGRGNLDDTTMQALAQNGNGTAAYIDTLTEARKVLVDQLTGALFTIAGDVKVQVEWNPAQVAEYRLIGYETRALNREDFNNDAVDAGELGAGHSVTAIYEVTPVGSPAQLSDPLRYQAAVSDSSSDELGFLKLRYKAPGESTSTLIETPITGGESAGQDAQFAAAIAGFGQLLRGNSYLGDWSYEDAAALAAANRGEDPFGYRNEALNLIRLAEAVDSAN